MLIDTIRRALESAGLFHREAKRIPGVFLDRSYSNGAGNLRYKLYIPARFRRGRSSLLVMLHGCRQTPQDFATGTRMNDLADEHGFLVVYPAQSAAANAFTCWNWFRCEKRYGKAYPATGGRTLRRRTVRHQPLRSSNIGCFMAQAMLGPGDSPRGPSPTHRGRMPRRRWFDFSWA